MTYDLIIIGGGPAGSAAAVYAARKRLKTLMLVAEWGGQSIVSEQIYNWIGTPSLSGNELAEGFKKHVMANVGDSLEVKELRAINIERSGEKEFKVITKDGAFVTKTLLIGTGSGRRKIDALNADKFENMGLTYCASCDGPLFADMDVAVIGGGNAGFESAAQLLAYCKSVTLLNRGETFRADAITVEKVLSHPKMKAVSNVDITEIIGDKFVEGLKYSDSITGVETTLPVAGIFVEIGQIPNTDFVKNLLPLDKIGRIEIDFSNQKTAVPGVWAAGDVTNVLYHQNNIAAGDAVRALEDIYLYLNT